MLRSGARNDMRRREFFGIVGAAATWPLLAQAQRGQRVRRIGVLMGLAADDPESQARLAAFAQGLQHAGWTVGAGLEFSFSPSWSAKAEYLYVNLGKFNCGLNCGAPTDNVSFTANIVRGGINYRF